MTESTSAWQLDALVDEVVRALDDGGFGDGRLIDGRVLAVKASPLRGNASKLALGLAALPPGFSTTPHSHEAEEVALVLRGSGRVELDGVEQPLEPGTLFLTPSQAVHITHANEGPDPLVLVWLYAPAGSEARWMEPTRRTTEREQQAAHRDHLDSAVGTVSDMWGPVLCQGPRSHQTWPQGRRTRG